MTDEQIDQAVAMTKKFMTYTPQHFYLFGYTVFRNDRIPPGAAFTKKLSLFQPFFRIILKRI